MHLLKALSLAALAASFTLVCGSALATTSAGASSDGGFGDTGGDFSSAWFITPLPNALYEGAPVTIDAEIGVYQGIDDQIMNIEILVDGTSIGSQACPDHCTFVGIELGKGVHQLQLLADSNGYTTSVTVYVDEELPATDTGSEGGEGGSESGGTGDESGDESSGGVDGGGGKGCNAQGEPLSPWALLTLPMLLLVPGFRRRQG